MAQKREPYLRRAREVSELTLPYLYPRQGTNETTDLPTPFQGVGGRGMVNLASRILLSLFPLSSPFFRYVADPRVLAEAGAADENAVAEIELSLASRERAVMTELETTPFRVTAHEAILHLLVAGNVAHDLTPGKKPRVFPLDRYVVDRDGNDDITLLITKEAIARRALPRGVRRALEELGKDDQEFDLFTVFERTGSVYTVFQEAGGITLPKSRGQVPTARLPVLPLRMSHISGESYGRGLGEFQIGDLTSLEGLAQAIVEGAAASARLLFLLDPAGSTREADLADRPNGGFAPGREEDVSALQVNKAQDFRVAAEVAKGIEERLGFQYLLNSAVRRDAERVTAEEIRQLTQELEGSLGGSYAMLTQEYQLPVATLIEHRLEEEEKIPALPAGLIRPKVVTGIEALGRGHDLNRLRGFMADARGLFGDTVLARLNPANGLTRLAVNYGIDPDGLVLTEEQVAQEQNRAMVQQLVETLGPAGIKELGALVRERQGAAPAPPA